MGVITQDIWVDDSASPGSMKISTVTDPRAYGLAVWVDTVAQLNALTLSDFFNGTLVVCVENGLAYFIVNGTKYVIGAAPADVWVNTTGDSMSGDLTMTPPAVIKFGSGLRQMMNLWGTTYGIGVQSNSYYERTPNSFAWFKGGVHSDTRWDPGAGGTLQMGLDTNGNLVLGKPAALNAGTKGIELQGAAGVASVTNDVFNNINMWFNKTGAANAGNSVYVTFRTSADASWVAGNITLTAAGGVTYGSGSDRRLKRIIGPVENSIERLRRIPVWHFAWKHNDEVQDGFMADEVQAVIPDAVTGEPDAVDGDGSIIPQQLDQGRMVPLLTAALQQALDKIDDLEARVAALEAA